ncbi:MFS transporter [Actinomadura harenae]|uniref:MFS transporter n=1 Tax=Actinomadura harenae TaxID=2483351 RepID=UPI001315731A|nr:MFS transporter [Actinomadura harenae]
MEEPVTPSVWAWRRFLAGLVVSGTGSTMTPLALSVALLGTGHGGTGVVTVLVAEYAAYLLALPAGGLLTDRAARHPGRLVRLLVLTQIAAGACQLVEGTLIASGRAGVWSLAVVAAAGAAVGAVAVPARRRLVPMLVPAGRLAHSNAVVSTLGQSLAVAGPPLGGLLISAVGPAPVIVWDGVSFLLAALVCAGLPAVRHPAGHDRTAPVGLAAGWQAITGRRWLWTMSLTRSVEAAAFLAAFVLGPLAAGQQWGAPTTWGLVNGALAAGSVTGGVWAMRLARTRPEMVSRPALLVAASGVALGIPWIVMAAGAPVPVMMGVMLAGGLLAEPGQVLWPTLVLHRIPGHLQGRVLADTEMIASVVTPLAYAVAGPCADHLGAPVVLGTCGVVMVIASLAPLATGPVRNLAAVTGPEPHSFHPAGQPAVPDSDSP